MTVSRDRTALFRALVCSVGLWILSGVSFADASDQNHDQLLAKLVSMQNAMRHDAYQGTLVFSQMTEQGVNQRAVQLRHWSGERAEFVGIESINGPAKSLFDHLLLAQSSLEQDGNRLSDYVLSYEGTSRVAGQEVELIKVIPKVDDRYGYLFAVQPESHLLLQLSIKNQSGHWVEKIAFTKLTSLDNRQSKQAQSLPFLDARPMDVPWRSAWLPHGFMLKSAVEREIESKNGRFWHLLYSDGIASVSVMIETEKPADRLLRGAMTAKGVSSYGRILADGTQIMVMGILPTQTVRRIATHVEACESAC